MDSQFGARVSVNVDGKNLPTYPVRTTNSDPSIQNFYLEAEAGKTYEIEIRCDDFLFGEHEAIQAKVQIDGNKVNGKSVYRGKTRFIIGLNTTTENGWIHYPLVFDKIPLSDNSATVHSNIGEQMGTTEDLGLIIVELDRITNIRQEKIQHVDPKRDRLCEPELFKEKVIEDKSIDMLTRLGEGQATSFKYWVYYDHVDELPCRTVIFQYRSREMLQSIGVIPQSPSPERRRLIIKLPVRQKAVTESATDSTTESIAQEQVGEQDTGLRLPIRRKRKQEPAEEQGAADRIMPHRPKRVRESKD